MSTTLDAIVDRVRSLTTTLGYIETQTPFSFDQQPAGAIDACLRIVERSGQGAIGGFKLSETRQDVLQIWVARKTAGEPTTAKRLLTRDMHSITAAVVTDGAFTSGEYAVLDAGRIHELRAEPGAEYAVLQMTVPVDYESQL